MTTVTDSHIDGPALYDSIHKVPVELIQINPNNPRANTMPDETLVSSVRMLGILEPLVLRPLPDNDGGGFMLLAGHRRLAAAVECGFTRVPAVLRHVDEPTAIEVMLVENLAREDLSPLEEAGGMAALLSLGRTQRQVAELLGVSQSHVSKRVALLKLPEKARAAVDSGGITVEAGVDLTRLPFGTVTKLFDRGQPSEFQINDELRRHEAEKKRANTASDLEAAGVKVTLDRPGWNREHPPCRVAYLNLPETIDHTSEPCRVVYVGPAGNTEECCDDPARHSEAADSDDGPHQRIRPGRPPERARREAYAQQAKAGRERRQGFTRALLAGGRPIPDLPDLVEMASRLLIEMSDFDPITALQQLGVDGVDWGNSRAKAREFLAADPMAHVLLLWALTLEAGEVLARDCINYGPADGDEEIEAFWYSARRYLRHLVGHGYEPDQLETELLGEQVPFDGPPSEVVEAAKAAFDTGTPARVVTVAKPGRSKKWVVTCSECGEVSRNTTEDYANQARDDHLWEKHGVKA